jgi:hypothetical protein
MAAMRLHRAAQARHGEQSSSLDERRQVADKI